MAASASEGQPDLPEGWIVAVSKRYPDRTYYFNTVTGATSWKMPELTQSLETPKKSKKKHRRHKKRHLSQSDSHGQTTQQQQTCEPDVDDDDSLDLTYEGGIEPDRVFCACCAGLSDVHHHLCDSKDSDKKPVTTERKRKQTLDSTSGVSTKPSLPAEDCGLTAEQLQLIRFPKCKHAKGIEARNRTGEVIDKRNLAEVTNTTSGHCGVLQECAGTNVDNLDHSIASKSMPENTVSGKVGGKKRKMSASSKTAKELRQDVESSQTKATGVKQRDSVSQPGEPSHASVRSAPPVLTSVKSGKARGSPLPGNTSSSVKGCSSVISDKSKGVAGHNQGADRAGEKTVGHKNAGRESKRRKRKNSSQTPGTSRAESHEAASLTRPPVTRGEEASTTASKPELPRTRGGQQGERTILKAKRRSNESPPFDKKSERKTPPASTATPKPSGDKGNAAKMSLDTPVSSKGPGNSKQRSSSPSIPSRGRDTKSASSDASTSRSTDCFQPKQKLCKDPSLSAFTAVRGQSHSVIQPSYNTKKESPHQSSDLSVTNRQRAAERSQSATPTLSVASPLPHMPEQSESGLSSPPVNLGTSSPSVNSGPPTQTVTSGLPVSSPLLLTPNQSGSSPPPVNLGTSAPGVFSHAPAQAVSSGILTPTVVESGEEVRNAFPITPDSASDAGPCGGGGRERAGEAAMEVDDNCYCDDQDSEDDQVMVDLQELRERFQPEMKAKAVGVLTESVQKMQTLKTISPVLQQASGPQVVYIVVDTNVLIGALSFLQTLREMSLKGFGHPFLVFPWVVLQELDGLKNSQNKSNKAQNAVRYIHSCLTSHHPRVQGQTPAQALEPVSGLPIECSDDRVLQCCLQCQKKYAENAVMLLTDDLNLENKAVVMGIKCFSSKNLQPLFDKPIYEIEHPPPRNDPPAGDTTHGQGAPQPRAVDTGRSTPVSATSGGRQTPQSREVGSPSVDNQHLGQQRGTMEGLLEEAKAIVKTVLTGVVQKEMKEAFGDLWLEMVIRKPPWSPQDLLVILQKHWIAVFSLKMDREMKTVVDELVKELRPARGVNRELKSVQLSLQRCLRLVTLVNQVSLCRESVQQLSDAVNRGRAVVQGSNRTSRLSPASPPGHLPTPRATDSGSARSSASAVPASSSSFSSSPGPSATIISSSIPLNHSRKPLEVAEDQNMKQAWSVSGTESLSLQKSSSAPDLRSSSPLLSGGKAQIPKTISAEENAAIGGVFQGIWGAIYNCCDNVENMMGPPQSGNNDLHSVKATLCRLLPQAVQLHEIYQKCLSLSPCVVDQHVDSFCRLCHSLNSFFTDANIPATPLPPVTPTTMIVFVQQTENRIPLLNGLEQLNNLIERLQALIACLPSIS